MPEEVKPETPSSGKEAAKPETETGAAAGAEGAPAAAPRPARTVKSPYIWGTGRRKTSVARVRIRPGNGVFQVNGKDLKDYFGVERHRTQAALPLTVANLAGKLDVFVSVNGGGPNGQSGAILMGVARALVHMDGALLAVLRVRGMMTRDSREVERKKYGLRKARRATQFSKR